MTKKTIGTMEYVDKYCSAELQNAAASVCDRIRDGVASRDELEKELRKIEPDIPEEKISRLLGYGFWVTR